MIKVFIALNIDTKEKDKRGDTETVIFLKNHGTEGGKPIERKYDT